MFQKLILLSFPFVLFFSLAKNVLAESDVVINEILANPTSGQKEFVELYFPNGSFDISAYSLKDKVNDPKILTNIENCGNYAIFEVDEGWLNNSGEESIYLNDNNNNEIDKYEDWSSPDDGKTLGRIPDGTGSFEENKEPTRCSANFPIDPTPTPDPSPTPDPTPASTTSQKSPSPTPKSSPKSSQTKSPSPTPPKNSPSVLGEKPQSPSSFTASSFENIPSPSTSPQYSQPFSNKTKIAAMIAGGGIILIGLSGVFYVWYKKYLDHKEKNKDQFE